MKNRKFLSLLLLVVAWGCKREMETFPSGSQVTSSASTDSALANQSAFPSPDIGYGLIPDGIYFIKSMAHPEIYLTLDVQNGSLEDGAKIQQSTQYWPAKSQWWVVTNGGYGYYSITNYRSGKCLDVPNASLFPGVKIQQFTCHGGSNQLWRIATSVSRGISWISNKNSGLDLDVPDGSRNPGVPIQQFTPNNGSNQTWKFIRVF